MNLETNEHIHVLLTKITKSKIEVRLWKYDVIIIVLHRA